MNRQEPEDAPARKSPVTRHWSSRLPLSLRRLRRRSTRSGVSPVLAAVLLGLFTLGLPGCEDDKSSLEEAIEEVGDEIEDAADEVKDEIDDHT